MSSEDESATKKPRIFELKRRESEEPREAFSVKTALSRISTLGFCESQMSDPSFQPLLTSARPAEYMSLPTADYARLNQDVIERFCKHIGCAELKLYTHQALAVSSIFAGENICISTSTSSGKSLSFNLPVLSDILNPDNKSTAIYMYPTKALAQDQKRVLDILLPDPGVVAVFDGDTEADARITAQGSAKLILTNPDMVHCTILKYHRKFKDFFAKLSYVVIDEAHCYRGSFGSHVASVIRRLIRIVKHYRQTIPQFICCSATIGNPLEHTQRLTGTVVHRVIDQDGSPSGAQTIVVLKVGTGNAVPMNAARLLSELVQSGGRVICFSRFRNEVELLLKLSKASLSPLGLQESVVSYRAGYTPEERRKLERAIFSGETSAVICTTALELGVDIGSLDCVISLGFPGSFMSMWQQFGRSGRSAKESLCFLLCREDDPIDLWLADDTVRVADSKAEEAIIQVDNVDIVRSHLLCADAEIELRKDRIDFEKNSLWPGCQEAFDAALKAAPFMKGAHTQVKLRNIAKNKVKVMLDNNVIDELPVSTAFLSLYPGAIHSVQGRELKIVEVDLSTYQAIAMPIESSYYTRTRDRTNLLPDAPCLKEKLFTNKGRLEYTTAVIEIEVDGYSKVNKKTQQSEEFEAIVPAFSVQYKSYVANCYLTTDEIEVLASSGLCVSACLHTATHMMLKAAQIRILCDRSDIKGFCPDDDAYAPRITVYDSLHGGLGIAEKIFQKYDQLLHLAKELLEKCKCDSGCFKCTQMPSCSRINQNLSKSGGILLIDLLLARCEK